MGQSERQIWYRQVPHIQDAYNKASQPLPYHEGDVYGFWVYNADSIKEIHIILAQDVHKYNGDVHVEWLSIG